MANRSQVGAVHFSLMFFVITTIGLGVAWYMTYSTLTESIATEKATEDKFVAADTQKEKYFDQIAALKAQIGHKLDEVGGAGERNANTVLGQMQLDIDTLGGELAGTDYANTLKKLREELDLLRDKRAELEGQVSDLQDNISEAFKVTYQDQVDTADAATAAAETRATTADKDRNEKVAAADAELKQRRAEVNDLQIELDKLQEDFEVKRKELSGEISLLRNVNTQLRERLDVVQKISFEQPDGVIRKVDHTTGLVWINLGSADDLPPRTSFSVYTKTHHGVGRGEDDIKGAIEVTRTIGPHLSEARILEEDYSSPISSNDPVYTPIWSPGRKHRFAVVGLIDIDGNDISDRQQFHEIVKAAGGVLDIEVDDEGKLTGDELTVHHKFLVMGEVPDATLEIDVEKQQQFERMMEARNTLVNDARVKGVRIVSLDLFLEWSGFRPQRRLWRPGDDVPWTIQQGNRPVGQIPGAAEAAGQVSKAYGNKRRLKGQESSSGQTSKTFGGPSGY